MDKASQIVFYSNHKIENCNVEMSEKIKVRDQACASNGFCSIKLGARNLGANNWDNWSCKLDCPLPMLVHKVGYLELCGGQPQFKRGIRGSYRSEY